MTQKALKNWSLALLVGVAGVGVAYALLVGKSKPEAAPIPETPPPLVRFVPADPGQVTLPVMAQGTVQAELEISLTSQVSGRVMEVSSAFVPGGFFDAGDTLVQIEEADYLLAIARAESQLASAQRTLAEEEGRALQARREWRDLGADKANSLFLREPQIAAAKASLVAAEADLENAHLNLKRTRLSLPFNGRIVSKSVDLGQFVGAGAGVARVYSTDRVQVRLPITDRQLALLELPLGRPGDVIASGPNVHISTVFAGERWDWEAVIERTEANLDVDSRVLYAVAVIDQPFGSDDSERRPPLTPGMFVEAEIAGRVMNAVARLPRNALRNDGTVLVVGTESQLEERSVRAMHSDGRNVWLAGLDAGARVVVSEDSLLSIGMTVTPTPAMQIAGGDL
ncbi:MAG: efflux RND transporter periplasmic adaptor subunit [Pseudomonadota bacterium]